MGVLVTDNGFGKADPVEEVLPPDSCLDDVNLDLPHLAIDFPSFDDGRGFGIAAVLRRRGFKGRLRATGYLLADQYPMARRVGFDEVEISQEQAQRQSEALWLRHIDWRNHDYQSRLGKQNR